MPTSRVVEESVPGKQVTIAHVIASPYETAMIAADLASKASDVEIGFLDRFTGSVVISGDVESVDVALHAVTETLERVLGFTVAEITRT